MKNKLVIIAAILGVGLVSAGIIITVQNQAKQSLTESQSALSIVKPSSTPALENNELVSYEDEADYSIKYPKSLTLSYDFPKDPHFSRVELTSATYSGKFSIIVDEEKKLKDKISAMGVETTLGGKAARKIESEGKIQILGTVNNKKYTVEQSYSPETKAYWTKIGDAILASFQFITAQSVDTSSPAYSDVIEEEAEEVIE